MKEKEIRDRIARFLEKTARTIVVPASLGLGLTAACERTGLHGKAADAGADLATQPSDASANPPDLAEDAIKDDLPQIMVPYLLVMVDAAPDVAPDLAADVAPDALEAQSVDADHDATETPLDVRAEIPYPPPPYLLPAMPPDEPPEEK